MIPWTNSCKCLATKHNAEVLHSKNASEVKEQVDRKWINMKFTDIGTSITFQLDEARSDYASTENRVAVIQSSADLHVSQLIPYECAFLTRDLFKNMNLMTVL